MAIIVGKKLKKEFLNKAAARTVLAKRAQLLMLEAAQADDYQALMHILGRLKALANAYESDDFTHKMISEAEKIEVQGLEEAFDKPYFSEFGCLREKKVSTLITGEVN